MKAIFVSSWDNGSSVFKSACEFNHETKEVTDIEVIDVDDSDLYYLDEEYVKLPSGEIIKDFIYDEIEVIDGQRQQE